MQETNKLESKTLKKKLLYEVSYIRPFVIFLLVFMHSFSHIKYIEIDSHNVELLSVYQWMIDFIRGFRIETIAFVAGYVFSYQTNDLNKRSSFWSFVKKKILRLIVPMLFFSSIYYFIFIYKAETFSFDTFIIEVLSGAGHLWFLPMLFWCFLFIWIIDYYKLVLAWMFLILAILTLIPVFDLPLGFSRLPQFLFYVYSGYCLWINKQRLLNCTQSNGVIVILIIGYIALVFLENLFITGWNLYLDFIWRHSIILVKACIDILALYSIVYRYTNRQGFQPSEMVVATSGICYGVYVFHQFILKFLYTYTNIYATFGDILTPWVGFAITLFFSIVLTKIVLKTNLGRFFIG